MIGRSLKRVEDQRFLLGRGTFVDDVALENAVYAAFVRSPHAHAVIGEISVEEAQAHAWRIGRLDRPRLGDSRIGALARFVADNLSRRHSDE